MEDRPLPHHNPYSLRGISKPPVFLFRMLIKGHQNHISQDRSHILKPVLYLVYVSSGDIKNG